MKTRQELIAATLALLQADGGAGQSPEPEDVEVIEKMIDSKLADLDRRQIASFPDKMNFADEYLDPLSTILANAAAPQFGQPRNPQSQELAEAMMRAFKPSTYVVGSVVAVDYF